MESTYDEHEHPYSERKEYAGFWIRFAAYLIDSIIIGIPLSILSILIFTLFFGASGGLNLMMGDPNSLEMTDAEAVAFMGSYFAALFVTIGVNFFVAVSYFAGFHASKWQATIGKKLLGLTVTDLNGRRISFWRGLGRYFAMILSSIFYIGFIIAGFTEKKQALHDFIASTVVIKKP